MEGYCPVTLCTELQWRKGDAEFQVSHKGATYWFASQHHLNRFRANPAKFHAVSAGSDVVLLKKLGRKVTGRRKHSLLYRDRIYLFKSEETLLEFGKAPNNFITNR